MLLAKYIYIAGTSLKGNHLNNMTTSLQSRRIEGAQEALKYAELGFVAEQVRYSRMYFQLCHAIIIIRLWLWRIP